MKFNNHSSLTRILPCLILVLTEQIAGLLNGYRLKSLSVSLRNHGEDTAVSCVSTTVSDEKTRKFLDWADAEGISGNSVRRQSGAFNHFTHFHYIYSTSKERAFE